jgi:hypothetical protein
MSGGTRIVQLVDLEDVRSNPDGTLTRNHKQLDRAEQCYFASPYDTPMYLRFWRRLVDKTVGKNSTMDNLGSTAEMDYYTFGVKLYVRYDRPQTKGGTSKLTFILEDGDGREVMASYER